MKTCKTKLSLLAFSFLLSVGVKAQNLVVTLTNSSVESFPISNIQSLKFGESSMTLYELNGTITTWEISNINNYAFDGSASIGDELSIENSSLTIFPNPSSNLVNVQFTSTMSNDVTIDVIDLNGKVIETLFQGQHLGEQTYQWNSNVQAGVYYCRIVTQNKVITKPITIQ